jgi:hypothetical protein
MSIEVCIYAYVLRRQLNEMHLSASDSKWVVLFRIISSSSFSLATISIERRLQVQFYDDWMIAYSLIFLLFLLFPLVNRRKKEKESNDKNDSAYTIILHWLLSLFLHQIVEYIHVLSSHILCFQCVCMLSC